MAEAELSFELDLKPDPQGTIKLAGTRITPAKEGPGSVRLLVRTNRGEALGPIERIASGGELSRISLVLQTLAVQGTRPALLILDEVDAGVGADLGPALARRLEAMADTLQVLVITHLPAVAAAASTHLVAQKSSRGDRTLARINQVSGDERLAELSRMVGGEKRAAGQVARGLLRSSRARASS
jgi:DNA repair protein RecN (Recombination protein N)